MYVTAKFDCPTFSRSEVIVQTNKQTDTLMNKETDASENIHFTSLHNASG